MEVPVEHHDILILGAGLTGINTAHILQMELPHRQFTILEKRSVIGGTWSFFKYPGFRSDSYMSTFGFPWYPWPHKHKMAQAHEIMTYINDAMDSAGLRDKIRLRHDVTGWEWRSEEQKWRLEVDMDGIKKTYFANFILGCTGYYSYEKVMEAVIPGADDFGGQVIHPQFWPEDLDYSDKKIVIIGSGATTVTLLPVLAEKAASVTQLQRSPSYVISRSQTTPIDTFFRMFLPLSLLTWVNWWADALQEVFFTQLLLGFPNLGRKLLMWEMKELLPKDIDVDVHFNPSYGPFQQRLCMCPEADYFKALHTDRCEVVTDVIETMTKDGILLKSGRKLDADIVITATGLYFELLGGTLPVVDGKPIHPGDHYTWRGCMLDGMPNTAFMLGYVTSTWTLGADVTAAIAMRVIKHMEKTGATSVVPKIEYKPGMKVDLAVNNTSSYFIKAADRMPKATGETPWYGRTHLPRDMWAKWFGSMEDGLVYTRGAVKNKSI